MTQAGARLPSIQVDENARRFLLGRPRGGIITIRRNGVYNRPITGQGRRLRQSRTQYRYQDLARRFPVAAFRGY